MRRIQRARDKEKIVEALCGSSNAIFTEIWQLLLFAAAVGYRHQRREKLSDADSGKAINPQLFEKSPGGLGFQYLLALVADKSAEHLSSSEENDDFRITLFEEYANGGLALLGEELEKHSYSLDSLLTFIEQPESAAPAQGSLSDVKL